MKSREAEIKSPEKTVGFNIEIIQHRNYSFNIFDVAGCNQARPLWKLYHFLEQAKAVIYMIDSSDPSRFEESVEALKLVVSQIELKDAVILILVNKIDKQDGVSVQVIRNVMRLDDVLRNRVWDIQGTSAINGDGLKMGLDWICDQLDKK